MKNVKLNDLVVFNHDTDATMFRVVEIVGDTFNIGVVDAELESAGMNNQKIQYIDHSLAKQPTRFQLSKFLDCK